MEGIKPQGPGPATNVKNTTIYGSVFNRSESALRIPYRSLSCGGIKLYFAVAWAIEKNYELLCTQP